MQFYYTMIAPMSYKNSPLLLYIYYLWCLHSYQLWLKYIKPLLQPKYP